MQFGERRPIEVLTARASPGFKIDGKAKGSARRALVLGVILNAVNLWMGGAQAAVYFIHADQMGTPQAVTDSSGAVKWRADRDPFGNTTILTSTFPAGVTMNLRFPGQYFDAETGLNDNRFRTYDPVAGRYIQSDPIGLKGGLNAYSYVDNNPLRWTDIFGLSKCKCRADPDSKNHASEDVTITRYMFFSGTGSRHRISCKYRCTKEDGTSEDIVGTTKQEYDHPQSEDVGDEGTCLGAYFEYGFNHDKWRRTAEPKGYDAFDPEGSGSSELEKWANDNCKCKT